MTKEDLVKQTATATGLTIKAVNEVVGSFFKGITDGFSKGESIRLNEIGTFTPFKTNERKGRHPQSGEPMVIPAKMNVRFKLAKPVRESLNTVASKPAAKKTAAKKTAAK